MKKIDFLNSFYAYRHSFLEPLYKGDYDALSETSLKILEKSQKTFQQKRNHFIQIGLCEGALLGYFDNKKARDELKEWAKTSIKSIQNIAQQICGADKPSEGKTADYYWIIAKAFFDEEKYDEALEHALLAMKANPKDKTTQKTAFDLFFQLGEHAWEEAKEKEAVKFYRMAFAIDTNKFGVHIPRSLKYFLQNNEYDQALIFFKCVMISSKHGKPEEELNLLTKEDWLQLCQLLRAPRDKRLPEEKLLDQILAKRSPPITDITLAALCGGIFLEMNLKK